MNMSHCCNMVSSLTCRWADGGTVLNMYGPSPHSGVSKIPEDFDMSSKSPGGASVPLCLLIELKTDFSWEAGP